MDNKVKNIVFPTTSTVISKLNNPQLRYGDTFRVLDIGNSFTEDCVTYMSDLVDYLKNNKDLDDSKMSFSFAYRGGASYKNWFNIFHNADSSSYYIKKMFGGLEETFTGNCGAKQGDCFRNALKNHKFNLIIIHQVSTYSGAYDGWEGTGDDGYLKEFIQLLRFYQPQATIGCLMTHASPRQMQAGESDTRGQWSRIAQANKTFAENYGIDIVIPAGTAVENLRISSANKGTHHLTRDNHHMADGLCRYTGTCAYWETVFAPYFGISVYNSGWTYKAVTGTYTEDTIQITKANAQIGQMCAMLACCDKYNLNNPDGKYIGLVEDIPTDDGSDTDNLEGYTEVTLTAGTNMEAGWWQYNVNNVAQNNVGLQDGTGDVIEQASNTTNNNTSNQSFFRNKLTFTVPLTAKIKLPTGYGLRPNYYNAETKAWYRCNPITGAGAIVDLYPTNCGVASNLVTKFNRIMFQIWKDGDKDSSLVTEEYINTQIAKGIKLYVKN